MRQIQTKAGIMKIIQLVKKYPDIVVDRRGESLYSHISDLEIENARPLIEEYFEDWIIEHWPDNNPQHIIDYTVSGTDYIAFMFNGDYSKALEKIKENESRS